MEWSDPNIHNSSEGSENKRYFPRWQVSNRVFFELEGGGEARECQSRDLSCSGVCLLIDQKVVTNQKIKLRIELSPQTSVDIEGHVLWSNLSPNGNLVGVIFTDLDPDDQDLILDYAFEVKKDDLVKYWFEGWNEKKP